MIEYIYFVKCPNCDDEPFSFFDEAKECALHCLSQKPIITQVEVNRNDFGECVDSCDLGTIWSWEEMMSDAEKECTERPSLLTKDFLKQETTDPEFDKLDNSVDVEIPEETHDLGLHLIQEFLSSKGLLSESNFNQNMSIDEFLKEFKRLCDKVGLQTTADIEYFMSKTADYSGTLLDRLEAYAKELDESITRQPKGKPIPEGMTIEQLVEEMEENEDMVECTWCNDLFPKDECRYEVDLGYLCSRCEAAIKSRGETLTFKENNYWDFLDEEVRPRDPFDHHDPDYDEDEAADYIAYKVDQAWDSRYDDALDTLDFFNEDFDDPVDEEEVEESIFAEAESVEDVVDILVKDEEEAIAAYEEAAEKIEELASEENIEETKEILDHIKEEEEEHIEELKELLPEEDETSEISDEAEEVVEEAIKMTKNELLNKEGTDDVDLVNAGREPEERVELVEALMIDCPECGGEKCLDPETGICNNCGFIIE